MDEQGIREALDRAIRARGETYASVSRLLGRNPTYIQQFIRRGVPRRLEEADRRRVARHLGLAEAEIGGADDGTGVLAPPGEAGNTDFVRPPPIETKSGAAPGPAFQAGWLGTLALSGLGDVAGLTMSGDAMSPTLLDGDQLLVDVGDAAHALRDGLYALRLGAEVVVKRLAINPANRRVTILNDNPAYPAWPPCDPATLAVVGRVLWTGRRLP